MELGGGVADFHITGWRVGDIVSNRFEILKEFGSGGFGRVLQVRDINDSENKCYALKHCHGNGEDLILKEARIYNMLNKNQNPFFCKFIVYDSWLHIPFIVIESMDCSLHYMGNKMYPEKPRISTCLTVCSQLFKGLEFLHRFNWLHMDIKPDNILCSYKENIVRLCDFGSARVFEAKPIPKGRCAPSNFNVGGVTMNFASINIAQKIDPSFRDDAIMICYSVIYFATHVNKFWENAGKQLIGSHLLESRKSEQGVNALVTVFDTCAAMSYGERINFIELGLHLTSGCNKDNLQLQWIDDSSNNMK